MAEDSGDYNEQGRKLTNLEKFFKNKTPEEIDEIRRKGYETRKKKTEERKKRVKDLYERAESMLPEVIARDILLSEDKNYIPKQETINKFKEIIDSGWITTDEIRKKYFHSMSDDAWHRLMKFVFKSHVSQIEDVGIEVHKAKNLAARAVKRVLREYRRQAKHYKDKKQLIPLGIVDRIYEAEKELNKINMDWAKTLHSIGAVGEKSKSASIHVHLPTPRPPKEDPKTIISQSRKVTLGSLLSKDEEVNGN